MENSRRKPDFRRHCMKRVVPGGVEKMLVLAWKRNIQLILLGFFCSMPHLAWAVDMDQRQVVDGLSVYLGVLPAEMISGLPKEHPDSQMHGGFPEDYRYHITVAIFDRDSGERLTDVDISARIIGADMIGPERKLETMTIGGERTYGSYFRMPGTGPYRIEVQIRLPEMSAPARAVFEWGRS